MGIIIFLLIVFFACRAYNKSKTPPKIPPPIKPAPTIPTKTPEQIRRENERQTAREKLKASAATDIEFYEPLRRDLINDIKKLNAEKLDAIRGGYTEKAEKIDLKIRQKRAALYRTEKKLEKAHFIIDE